MFSNKPIVVIMSCDLTRYQVYYICKKVLNKLPSIKNNINLVFIKWVSNKTAYISQKITSTSLKSFQTYLQSENRKGYVCRKMR